MKLMLNLKSSIALVCSISVRNFHAVQRFYPSLYQIDIVIKLLAVPLDRHYDKVKVFIDYEETN